MPTWEGIEDASPIPAPVWLSRLRDEDEWKPLRKADCHALNSKAGEQVVIEGGRAIANPISGEIWYNFFNGPSRQLKSATWFVREEKSSKEVVLKPMTIEDASLAESLYQMAVQATSSLGKGLDSVLHEEKELHADAEFKLVIAKSGSNILSIKKRPKSWFGNISDLQRGYGEYSIEGEDEEMSLGPVNHLFFVIHGIGQAFINREDVKMMTLIEEIDAMRMLLQRRQLAEWKKACDKAKKDGEAEPAVPNRIEVLPIEWWDKIHNSSSSLVRSLRAATLPTIPGLRSLANDVVFDVLMYLTPTFCETVLSCVTNQIDDVYHTFNRIHPDFNQNGGKCSLIGHSLGSVITWDLLSILKDRTEQSKKSTFNGVHLPNNGEVGYQAYAAQQDVDDVNTIKHGSWGPSLSKPIQKCLPFVPEFTLFLGSPIGMFLTLRGAHAVFDEMLQTSIQLARAKATEAAANAEAATLTSDGAQPVPEVVEVPRTSPFDLPCRAVYNIFHPSDPVAYRIEPLLLTQELVESELPPPVYLTKKGQKVRLHVQARQLGDGIVKSLQERKSSVKGFFSSITEQAVAVLSTVAEAEGSKRSIENNLKEGPLKFALGGTSDRVDYCLQPGVIENEYFAAVTAHSCYFYNPDVIDFILDLTEGLQVHIAPS